ncbi:RidA family protein [Candidatus Enterococcus ikei]|uniref:RidA family protein n=1 Tax=Candidatus Enterococcus ikei TaxID=2815326 RepID=A0ABS3GWH1_9ENTE|nr:RidA family protein [Enterococcus sp. DIV0869a]MBO0439622.1 RidA family protein [Enterococcus sp. DIV0869a]
MKIYSDSIIVNSPLLIISGQTPQEEDTTPTLIEDQLDIVIKKIEKIIQENNTTKEKIAKMNVYITDSSFLGAVRKKLSNYYGKNKPAMTLVVVSELVNPKFKVEIDALVSL